MRFLTSLIVVLLMALPVSAQQDQVRQVISGQINAFLADDFETAFSYASPSIKQMFGVPEVFGEMVSKGYPMVHRPAEFQFKALRPEAEGVVQNVLILDQKGTFFIAEYTLLETENGWKISGVTVLKAPGVDV